MMYSLAQKRRRKAEEYRRRAEERELAKQQQEEEAAAAAAAAASSARPLVASRLNNNAVTTTTTKKTVAVEKEASTSRPPLHHQASRYQNNYSDGGEKEASSSRAGGRGDQAAAVDHRDKKSRRRSPAERQEKEEGPGDYRRVVAPQPPASAAREATTTSSRRHRGGVPEDVAVAPPIDPSPLSSVGVSQSPGTAGALQRSINNSSSSVRIPNKNKKRSITESGVDDDGGGGAVEKKETAHPPSNNINNKADNDDIPENNEAAQQQPPDKPLGEKWSKLFGDSSDDDFDSDGDDDFDSEEKKVAATTSTKKTSAAAAGACDPASDDGADGDNRNKPPPPAAANKNNKKCEQGGDGSGGILSQSSDTTKRSTYFQRQREDADNQADSSSGIGYSQDDSALGKAHRKVHNYDDNEDKKGTRSKYNAKRSSIDDMDTSESEADDEATPARSRTSIHSRSSRSSSSSTPRNPLALMRAEQNRYGRNKTAHALEDTPPEVAAASANAKLQPRDNNNNNYHESDGLWSDDDDEMVIPASSSPKKRKRAAIPKRKKSPPPGSSDSGSDTEDKKPAAADDKNKMRRAKKPPPKRRLARDFQEDVSSDDEDEELSPEEAKATLHPDFGEEPKFGPFAFQPLPLEIMAYEDSSVNNDDQFEVPASISRYLPVYQQEGIQFMFQNIVMGRGAILGDDMGLGKTVQVVSLLSALLKKTGTYWDAIDVKRRVKFVTRRLYEYKKRKQEQLNEGKILTLEDDNIRSKIPGGPPDWSPILIIVPPSVVEHWKRDFATWGHFGVSVYETGTEQEVSLQRIRHGASEILICTKSCFQQEHAIEALCDIDWKLVIIDEFHMFKNVKGKISKNLRLLKEEAQPRKPVIVGLTGTLMQNDHKELWNLIDLVEADFLGDWKAFQSTVANPIKQGRAVDADEYSRLIGEEKAREFKSQISLLFKERKKEDVLKDKLPEKEECIIFCELSKMQKQVYKYVIKQPDFLLVSQANAPCDCGVNNKYHQEYSRLSSIQQKKEYLRRNEFTTRARCCHPWPKDRNSPDGIAPNAVLWRQRDAHGENGEICEKCPYCVAFPCMHVLFKLSSHIALLQGATDPKMFEEGSKEHQHAVNKLEKARAFLPPDIVRQLPGRSHIRSSNIMDDHYGLSGKMKVLNEILKDISRDQGRVLLFSASTQMLDLIENYVRTHYKFLRMDGTTPAKKRQLLADKFDKNPEIMIFLLSTKAMGLGLNLSSANYVIIFDVDWNPSYDAQAQDRAYRIGQRKDVKVFRLVSRGTVEEMKFLRQLYKTDLKTETLDDLENLDGTEMERRFRGVAGDKDRKGELFGLTNLLKYKDGNFKTYKSTASSSIKAYGAGVYRMEDLKAAMENLSEAEIDELGNGDGGIAFPDVTASNGQSNTHATATTNHWSWKPRRRLLQLEEGGGDDDNDNNPDSGNNPTGEAQDHNGSNSAAVQIPECQVAAAEDNASSDEDEYIGGETQVNINIFEARAADADDDTSDHPNFHPIKEEEEEEEEEEGSHGPDRVSSAGALLTSATLAENPVPDKAISSSSFVHSNHSSTIVDEKKDSPPKAETRSRISNKTGNGHQPPSSKLEGDLMKDIFGGDFKKSKKRKKRKN